MKKSALKLKKKTRKSENSSKFLQFQVSHNENAVNAFNQNRLDHLDDFSLMNMFDFLDLPDIIKVTEMNLRFEQIIMRHYLTHKFHLNTIPITIVVNEETTISAAYSDKPFAIGHEQSVWVLQRFGHIFSHINLHYQSFRSYESQEITYYIDKKCPKALKEVTISGLSDYSLDWPYTYEYVTCVTLNNLPQENHIELNRLFPHMEKLVFNNSAKAQAVINHYFPHLIDFSIRFQSEVSSVSRYLTNFIRLNRQIRNFDTPIFTNPTYLQYVNEMFGNLEILTIRNEFGTIVHPNHETVQFKKVTKFSLYLSQSDENNENVNLRQILPPIEFDKLESFELFSTCSNSIDALINVIARNRELKSVRIGACELTYDQLRTLVQSLPTLKELAVDWHHTAGLYEIRRFLMDRLQLQRIAIPIHGQGWGSQNLFRMIPDKWIVSRVKAIGSKRILLLTQSSNVLHSVNNSSNQ